jgi:3'-phosphoadenosine 5'-phosphosulfate sulfotransferase (PAPS reductase)/FAD synthetase
MNKNGKLIVSVSGGKDSTAMCLHLFELGYTKDDFDRVFMDTGWEHASTYEYLDELESTVGKIIRLKAEVPIPESARSAVEQFEKRLGFESPFIRRVFKYQSFPSRRIRWCTRELKIAPVTAYFDSLDYEFISVVGIRKEESLKRSKMEEWEYSDHWDAWVWRPLINWTEKDVIDIHHRFGLVPNRLYLNGSTRVGCYPCINSRKKEIKNLEDERISLIRDLEIELTKMRRARKGEDQHPATFFSSPTRGVQIMTIDEVRNWSLTTYGGKQFEMFSGEEPTCVRWGMCNL